VVQEIGWDDDCDEQIRESIAAVQDVELVDEDFDDVVDVVLLWWRDGDGDLVEALLDALTPLADGGYIWLFTPKAGRDGHVEPSEIGESAPTAGLSQTSTVSAGRDWSGSRLVSPKAKR
jgi:SAM-dependent methyltransferase